MVELLGFFYLWILWSWVRIKAKGVNISTFLSSSSPSQNDLNTSSLDVGPRHFTCLSFRCLSSIVRWLMLRGKLKWMIQWQRKAGLPRNSSTYSLSTLNRYILAGRKKMLSVICKLIFHNIVKLDSTAWLCYSKSKSKSKHFYSTK